MKLKFIPAILTSLVMILIIVPYPSAAQGQEERPNILWLVSEDNSPFVGAYGDDFATTPNLDQLASEGFMYTNAYANAPVCAPSRNTIITGVYANSGGNQHHRSNYEVSSIINFFPRLLREAGYYTTNNAKEDYNIATDQTRDIWDESSEEAHYSNRDWGQPFFAVFNTMKSHESTIHNRKSVEDLRYNPQKVSLPPYHPDTPEIRREWAQYYDSIEEMDRWIGEKLQELEESNEAENTIVFYYGDHGGVLPRSKRYVYESGTRVPFIVRIPEKFKHLWPANEPGSEVDRLVGLVDLAPTLLSIVDIEIPAFMQGDAFLGEQKTPNPYYAYMFNGRFDERNDMSRAVRDQRYRYIRNYMPYRVYGQRHDYMWRAASIRSWEQTCQRGECNEVQNAFWNSKPAEELYDTRNDPWEVHNLASDPSYQNVLERMRKANHAKMLEIKDSGFIPEAELTDRADELPIYDYMRSGNVPLEELIETAEKATLATEDDIPLLKSFLKSDDSAIRYWGTTGLLILGEYAKPAIAQLKAALNDSSPSVVVIAAEALYNLGEKAAARSGFQNALQASNPLVRTEALNAIESVDENSQKIKEAVVAMAREAGVLKRENYDHRSARVLLDKWNIHAAEYGIEIDW